MNDIVVTDPWRMLERLTPARIALGRVGASLPTSEILRFSLAQAKARDAVHTALDIDGIKSRIEALGIAAVTAASAAETREIYLHRPDLGRRLDWSSRQKLESTRSGPVDIALVVADGLSATAIHAHALPFLRIFQPWIAAENWRVAPVVIASQARVALGDEIGEILKAQIVVMLIGERPGLSSPDSLGIYLTYGPRIGRSDAERNCISNIRPDGLSFELAAFKLAWLVRQALQQRLTGVALKDESDLIALEAMPTPLLRDAT